MTSNEDDTLVENAIPDSPGNDVGMTSMEMPQTLISSNDDDNPDLEREEFDGIGEENPDLEREEFDGIGEENPDTELGDFDEVVDDFAGDPAEVYATSGTPEPVYWRGDDATNGFLPGNQAWAEARQVIPKKLAVKWSDYEHFKNRFGPDDGFEVIEVLYGHPYLEIEIAQEEQRRELSRPVGERIPEDGSRWIQRVRIQSPAILHILSQIMEDNDVRSDQYPSLVFFRPFSTFYYTLPIMKRCLELLQHEQTREECDSDNDYEASDYCDLESPTSAKEPTVPEERLEEAKSSERLICAMNMPPDTVLRRAISDVEDPADALQHVQVYVEFVETHINPVWEEAFGSTKHKARFYDLPLIFRPGELLCVPKGSVAYRNHRMADVLEDTHDVFKLCYVTPAPVLRPGSNRLVDVYGMRRDLLAEIAGHAEMHLHAYHIDFDGETYKPFISDFTIDGYIGERDIRSLPVYPLRYAKDFDKLYHGLRERGKRFLSIVKDKHLYYNGWALGQPKLFNDHGERHKDAEHIEGEIIIDFKEGYQSCPDLKQENRYDSYSPSKGSRYCYDSRDYLSIVHWGNSMARTNILGQLVDHVRPVDYLDVHHWRAVRKRDKFLMAYDAKEPWLKKHDMDLSSYFDEDELALFPQRLIAYSLRTRKFFSANIDCISNILAPKNTFKDLKIDSNHKKVLRSLIRSHFQKKQMRRLATAVNWDQDFIRGKGAGLIILLHGVPGVGKTTTAEAVALSSRKPLFAITSGDLGSTPGAVEKALQETFRLAQLWDCVLLLDEADLFLSRREVEDLERNSLVSVFLRVLEYYNGVLFLTTNRVGTIDEAFKSRIHLSLYYPPLNRQQTLEIFGVNLRRLREIEAAKAAAQQGIDQNDPSYQPVLDIDERRIMHFAKRHFESHKESERWNGRQIRNAFQVAYSLAQSGNEDDSDDESVDDTTDKGRATVTKATLDDQQFEMVSETIEKFDRYLVRTRGLDADRAREYQVRNDRYRDFAEDEGRGARRPWLAKPEKCAEYLDRGPDLRLEGPGAPRYSPGPSFSGVSDVDMDDKGWGTDQTRSQKRRSVPQQGGSRLPMGSPRSSTHLSPASPMSRLARDLEYKTQPLANSEDYSDEDNMSHRGSVGGGTAKYRSRHSVRDEYMDDRRF